MDPKKAEEIGLEAGARFVEIGVPINLDYARGIQEWALRPGSIAWFHSGTKNFTIVDIDPTKITLEKLFQNEK